MLHEVPAIVEGLYRRGRGSARVPGVQRASVAKNPGRTAPGPEKISYDQILRFMSLWFSGVLGIPLALFKKQWATQSGRSGSASAAANAGIPAELWGQHGD